MGVLLFVGRSVALAVLLFLVTVVGALCCVVFYRSSNKVYHIARVFGYAGRLLGIRVKRIIPASTAALTQAVYIANHQNNMDLFSLSTAVPQGVVCVGKKSLIWIPLFGVLYWASGNILINRQLRHKAIATIDQIAAQMKASHLSIWMFPEGTRSRGKGLLPFKTGAFHAALQAGVPIVPVVCSDTHNKIHLNRCDNGTFVVEMLEPIATVGLTQEDIPRLIEQCHSLMSAKLAQLDRRMVRLAKRQKKRQLAH